MSEFQRHMRNVMLQDQVEAVYRDYLKQMSDDRIAELAEAGTDWMEANPPQKKRHYTLRVPADVAHGAVALFVLRLSAELNERIFTAEEGGA